MKVYRIQHDVNNFQYFLPEDPNIWQTDMLTMNCSSKIKKWVPPKVYSYKPHLKIGDFWNLGTGMLVTTAKATKILATFLEMSGELLPLPYQEEEFTILNITECINCLDHTNTKWVYGETTGAKIRIEEYAFHPDRFSESTIFKIPETCKTQILVIEGLKNPEDEFKHIVEETGLLGIDFEQIWEG